MASVKDADGNVTGLMQNPLTASPRRRTEFLQDDVNKFVQLARSRDPVNSL